MFLKSISLQNFRNHKEANLRFRSRLVFFIGDNGAGKTNLLEAISLLSYSKSFRGNSEEELLQFQKDFYFLRAQFERDEEDHKIEIGFEAGPPKRRRIRLDGNLLTKKTDLVGEFPTVVLAPTDLKILDGGSQERRKFFDALISNIDREYLVTLMEYNRVLKQRNTLLKTKPLVEASFRPWDELLVEKEDYLRKRREELVKEINPIFQKNLSQLSGSRDDFGITYKSNISSKEEFSAKLKDRLYRDVKLGYTSSGCHRDDFQFGKEGRDILEFGSQGQKRSTVIALKTAAYSLLKLKIGSDPILLIDDVIRELDVKRREYFVELIRESGQAFFTTTDLEGISDYVGSLKEEKEIYFIKDGQVEQYSSL